jgi:hypothetical protein
MSSSKAVNQAILTGESFTKTVLAVWPTRSDALSHEILLHSIFSVDTNPKFYNKARQTSAKFSCSTKGMKHSSKTIELLRSQKQGVNNPNYGKTGPMASAFGHRHTPEQRQKMKNAGSKNGMYGKHHKDSSKKLMSENRRDQNGDMNPFFGKHHRETSKRYGAQNHMFGIGDKHPRARAVHTPFGEFSMVKAAADALRVSEETIRNRIKSPYPKFVDYFYIKE